MPGGHFVTRPNDNELPRKARVAPEKMIRRELRQAELPMILIERKSLDEEGASNMPSDKGSEGNPEGAERAGDHWGGICGCRSPGYLAAQSPKQQT